jgi:hypothetical protein
MEIYMIKLGTKVKDSVNGFEGIATSRVTHINGHVQYGVTPKVGKDGKRLEIIYLEEARINGSDLSNLQHTESGNIKAGLIHLGNRVKDSITGFEGIATARIEYLTGCAQIAVTPKMVPSPELPNTTEYFDEHRLTGEKLMEVVKTESANKRANGGPSIRIPALAAPKR